MRVAFLVVCLLLTCGAGQAAERPMNRDAQWIYRERNGDGGGEPSATFLSDGYDWVLFSARCHRTAHTVTLLFWEAPGEDLRKAWDRRPLTVVLGRSRVTFPTTVVGADEALGSNRALSGTLRITPGVLASFTHAMDDEVSIEAPEDEYGAWFVGKAEPLRRLVRACA